ERVLALHQKLRGAEQDLAALGRRQRTPARVGRLGRGHRACDVLRPRIGEAADQVIAVGGVAVLERPPRGRRDPRAVDEVAEASTQDAATLLRSSLRPDMSLLPLNIAPSATTILGARMLPVSLPEAWISTRLAAAQSPTTSPLTTTD